MPHGDVRIYAITIVNELFRLMALSHQITQWSHSLLVQLLRDGRLMHGANLGVYCENYPVYETEHFILGRNEASVRSALSFYEDPAGSSELRRAIASRDNAALTLQHISSSNVVVTNGATHAIYIILTLAQTQFAKVLFPEPSFIGYHHICESIGIASSAYRLSGYQDWDLDALLPRVDGRTILIVNTPHNPSGSILRDAQLVQLAERAKETGCLLLFDVVYDAFAFDRDAPSWAGVSSGEEDLATCVFVNSFSKTYGVPGLRLGWITAAGRVVSAAASLIERQMVCVSTLTQTYGVDVLSSVNVDASVAVLRSRRDYLCECLFKLPGVVFSQPEGGTTLLVDLPNRSGLEVVRRLLRDHAVLLLPGVGYFGGEPTSIRLSFGYRNSDIDRFVTALNCVLSS